MGLTKDLAEAAPGGTMVTGSELRRWAARVRLAALPLLVLAALAALDMATKPEFVYLPLVSLGPAFAAAMLRPAEVAVVGGLAAALWYPMVSNDGLLGSFQGYVALVTIVGATVAGVAASVGRMRRERQLAEVRAVADIAQRVLLRAAPATMGPLQIAARYVSAAPSARIGGDMYDIVPTGGRAVRLIVGDVQGKGLSAVQAASVVLGAFRETAYDAPGLAEIARRIELSLGRQTVEEEFVTAVLAQLGEDGGAIEILNCGHPPPLLMSGGRTRFAEPPQPTLPLGLSWLAAAPRTTCVVPLGPGDQLLFYTDGISEARDSSGAFYPLELRCRLLGGPDPDQALEQLSADVARHVGGPLRDDAAMLLLRRTDGDLSCARR